MAIKDQAICQTKSLLVFIHLVISHFDYRRLSELQRALILALAETETNVKGTVDGVASTESGIVFFSNYFDIILGMFTFYLFTTNFDVFDIISAITFR